MKPLLTKVPYKIDDYTKKVNMRNHYSKLANIQPAIFKSKDNFINHENK